MGHYEETELLTGQAPQDEITRGDLLNIIRRQHYVIQELLDHVDSVDDFRPANRDDWYSTMNAVRDLIYLVRTKGLNR